MDRFIKPTKIELSEEEYEEFMEWLNSPSENKKAKELMDNARLESMSNMEKI